MNIGFLRHIEKQNPKKWFTARLTRVHGRYITRFHGGCNTHLRDLGLRTTLIIISLIFTPSGNHDGN
jgi:hypothetical protein